MRLIDADAMRENIERIKQNVEEWVNQTECDNTKALVRISLYEEFIDLIDNAPTVKGYKNVIVGGMNNPYNAGYMDGIRQGYKECERPHGEWKLIRVADHCGIHDSFVCPFCNYEREYRKKNFCEECGADMRGKQK